MVKNTVNKKETGKNASIKSNNSHDNDEGKSVSPERKLKLSDLSEESDSGSEDEDDDGSEDEEEEEEDEDDALNENSNKSKKQSRKNLNAAEMRAARSATEAFKSNIFKLQVDEVLKEIDINEKYASEARKLLFSLRESISSTKQIGPLDFKSAQNELNVRIPFNGDSEDGKDIKYKFSYVPPAIDEINVIGSWSLRTTVRKPNGASGVDLYVPMDKSLFEQKDYLDFRYHRKRAFFIAALASQLADFSKLHLESRFVLFNGHPLRPTLQLVPTGPMSKLGKHLNIYIHVGPPVDTFPLKKLRPDRNANRKVDGPTPIYNWSILADVFAMPLLKYLHYASTLAPSFVDAVRLGSLWLFQRGWSSDPVKGGFGSFEFAVLMASLLQGGSKTGKKRLLPGYSSYQLFKGTLLYLAESENISLNPSFSREGAGPTKLLEEGTGIVFSDSSLDILANMPKWSWRLLRLDAQLAVDMLNDSTRDRFHSLFLRNVNESYLRFDLYFEVSLPESKDPIEACNSVTSILECALGQRFSAMKVTSTESFSQGSLNSTWSLSSDTIRYECNKLFVGLILDVNHANKRVTFPGPEVNNDSSLFKEFWGSKASVRRFKDGTIKDAVVWEHDDTTPIVIEASQYALKKHLKAVVHFSHSLETHLLNYSKRKELAANVPMGFGFAAMSKSFQQLGTLLTELRSALPLRITAVYGTSAALRHCSLAEPSSFNPEDFAEGVIEMESSSRWPADAEASEKVKTAFLIKIAEVIREEHSNYFVVIGVEPYIEDQSIESAFAIIQTPEGFYFKLRIVSRSTIAKTHSPLIGLADHTRLMTTMIHRYPFSLSMTVRLLKLWLEKQMLMTHITEPAVELLALHVFVNSSPWNPPATGTTGFWRVLDLLSRWDWHEQALYLDVDQHTEETIENNIQHQKVVTGCDMDADLFRTMTAAFEKQRKQDPALTQAAWVIFTKLDLTGIEWTHWEPRSKVGALIASRVTALSRAAKPGKHIFKTSLSDFDLTWKVTGPKSNVPKHKNIAVSNPRKSIMGAHHVHLDLVNALIKLYKDSLVFFYSGSLDNSSRSQHTLCAIWNPTALAQLKKIKANINYPIHKEGNDNYTLDKEALLSEIDRLGSGILKLQNKKA